MLQGSGEDMGALGGGWNGETPKETIKINKFKKKQQKLGGRGGLAHGAG